MEDALKRSELAAIRSFKGNKKAKVTSSESETISRVVGKTAGNSKKRGLLVFGPLILIGALLIAFPFIGGHAIPDAISERLIESMDVQYADAVQSKILVFGEALSSGDVPKNTASRLKDYGVLVGQGNSSDFTETNQSDAPLSLFYQNQVISAENFANKVNSDAGLYDIFNKATYGRAAYYYDEAAKAVFQRIGTSRNNYSADSDFDEVMNKLLGEGSNLTINNVGLSENENESGEITTDYDTTGSAVSSKTASLVEEVRNKNTADTKLQATLNAADTLNTADTVANEQRSALLFLAFMENISKMKAGAGNESNINEALSYLYEEREIEVLDVATGQMVTTKGSMVESPSLYAVLSGDSVDVEKVTNYSNDRILKTTENQLGVENAGSETLLGTISSIGSKIRGIISRFLSSGSTRAGEEIDVVAPIIEKSLVNNKFETIGGISGGEMLVAGAVNVGKELAKASGGATGDAEATLAYLKLNDEVLALDAEADRLNRSPFDITSKNTFLGSIVHKIATSVRFSPGSLTSSVATLSTLAYNSVLSSLPSSVAEDYGSRYLGNFGDCEHLREIGGVGSATCSAIITFDTSTLNDTFNNSEFISFVEENTTLNENGQREIKSDSKLADYIKYNNERITPAGIVDGGILSSLQGGSSSKIPVLSNIVAMIKTWLGADEEDKRVASGATFVNSTKNTDWEEYKYAQRYVSLSRAADTLRAYDGDETAYSNLRFYEGSENPVMAFLNKYQSIIAENN